MASKMTVSQLKAALKKAGLSTSGKKAELVARLEAAEGEEEEEELDPSSMSVAELKKALKAKGMKTGGKKADLIARLSKMDDDEEEEPAPKPKAASKKRKPTSKPAAAKAPAKKKGKSKGVRKVDPACPLGGASVHEDFDCMLNQTNVGANNNKFYRIQVLKSGSQLYLWTHWGRVGESGQHACAPQPDAKKAASEFAKKFRSKTKNKWDDVKDNIDAFTTYSGKYTLLEMSHDDEDEDEINDVLAQLGEADDGVQQKVAPSKLDKRTGALMKLIFDNDMFKSAMVKFDLDVKKMPLGKLSKNQIDKGYDVLEELGTAINNGNRGQIQQLTGKFYTVIPHSFGRQRPPLLQTAESVQNKKDMLAVLTDIAAAQELLKNKDKKKKGKKEVKEVPHPLDTKYDTLNADISVLDKKSKEFKVIEKYLAATNGYRRVSIVDVFEVNRSDDRFLEHEGTGNRKLLWHGTNVAVVAAILSSGLRIMPHSGGRVGRGIYFASENSKSAGYVRCAGKTGIMFLNEVVLGKSHEITKDDSSLRKAPKGCHSVLAQGQTEPDPKFDTELTLDGNTVVVPQGKAVKRPEFQSSYFSQSEYLVYKESQQRIRYMLRCTFG